MMRLFEGFAGAHGTHGEPRKKPDSLKWEIKSTAKTVKEPVLLKHWQQHMEGTRPLGVITIREDGMCIWGGIDYDVYDADLLKLIERVEALKLPLVPCRSKSGGLHLFLFLKDWAPAADVMSALKDMSAQIGIAGSEIYPKQVAVLTERGDLGNWIVMPYFGSTYNGKIQEQVGLTRDGRELSLPAFIRLAEERSIGLEDLDKLTRKRATPARVVGKKGARGSGGTEPDAPFGDGPPCLQTLATDKVQRGYQSNALLMMGIYYKRKYPVEWQDKLSEAARTFLDPPGSEEGTQSVIRSLEKKDYEYTCKTEPMCSHCSVAICRTRQFGVGDESDYPSLSGLVKLEADPPVYFLDINGKRVELSEDQVFNYPMFNKAAFGQANAVYAPMAQKDWTLALKAAVENMVENNRVQEAAPDAHRGAEFMEILEEFLTNKLVGDRMEDCFGGRPCKDDEKNVYVFRLRDLREYFLRYNLKEWTRGRIAGKLLEMKASYHQFHVKGRCLKAWQLDAKWVTEPQPLETPAQKESPI